MIPKRNDRASMKPSHIRQNDSPLLAYSILNGKSIVEGAGCLWPGNLYCHIAIKYTQNYCTMQKKKCRKNH